MLRVFLYDTHPRPLLVAATSPKQALKALVPNAVKTASASALRAVSAGIPGGDVALRYAGQPVYYDADFGWLVFANPAPAKNPPLSVQTSTAKAVTKPAAKKLAAKKPRPAVVSKQKRPVTRAK